jgi:hypothetical protein
MFTPLYGWYGYNGQVGDRNIVLNRILSTSVIFEKQGEAKAKIMQHLNHILDTHPQLKESRRTGKYEIAYATHVAWVHKV